MLHQIPRSEKTTQFNYCNASKDATTVAERRRARRHVTVARANMRHTAEEEERSAGNGTNDPSKRNSKEIGTFMAKQETQSQERSIALLVAREKTAGGNGLCESPTSSQSGRHCEEKTKAKPQNQPTTSRSDPAAHRHTRAENSTQQEKRRSLS